MSTAFSAKLPKIVLDKPGLTRPPGLDLVPSRVQYTITPTYKHITGGAMSMDWTKEYSNDFIAANDVASRIRKFKGYRFNLQMTLTDKFLSKGSAGSYEQELFEQYMNYLSIWEDSSLQVIFVYPWNDLSTYYACTLDGYVKTPGQDDDQPKTCWHNYQVSLSALNLVTTKPTPSY